MEWFLSIISFDGPELTPEKRRTTNNHIFRDSLAIQFSETDRALEAFLFGVPVGVCRRGMLLIRNQAAVVNTRMFFFRSHHPNPPNIRSSRRFFSTFAEIPSLEPSRRQRADDYHPMCPAQSGETRNVN